MPTTQYLVILGTIYIAPHLHPKISMGIGCVMVSVAIVIDIVKQF